MQKRLISSKSYFRFANSALICLVILLLLLRAPLLIKLAVFLAGLCLYFGLHGRLCCKKLNDFFVILRYRDNCYEIELPPARYFSAFKKIKKRHGANPGSLKAAVAREIKKQIPTAVYHAAELCPENAVFSVDTWLLNPRQKKALSAFGFKIEEKRHGFFPATKAGVFLSFLLTGNLKALPDLSRIRGYVVCTWTHETLLHVTPEQVFFK